MANLQKLVDDLSQLTVLEANEKAAQEWELERRFAVFEANVRDSRFER